MAIFKQVVESHHSYAAITLDIDSMGDLLVIMNRNMTVCDQALPLLLFFVLFSWVQGKGESPGVRLRFLINAELHLWLIKCGLYTEVLDHRQSPPLEE